MPIYEYRCEPCDHAFETLIRSRDDVPHFHTLHDPMAVDRARTRDD